MPLGHLAAAQKREVPIIDHRLTCRSVNTRTSARQTFRKYVTQIRAAGWCCEILSMATPTCFSVAGLYNTAARRGAIKTPHWRQWLTG